MDFIIATLSFVVALSILIAIHEYGHFIVARWCGVRVLKFSIGFGKTLYSRFDKHGTEFVISAIPLGGYVKMLDARVDDVPEALKSQAFNHKSISKRAAIISAGPLANFLLAILFYWIISMVPQETLKPVIGDVLPDSIVAKAQIEPESELKAIGGRSVQSWSEVILALANVESQPNVIFEVANLDGYFHEEKSVDLSHWKLDQEGSLLTSLGIVPVTGDFTLFVTEIVPGSAAELAGLQAKDEILTVNGEKLATPMALVNLIKESPQKPLQLMIKRDNAELTKVLTPLRGDDKAGKVIGKAGIGIGYKSERPAEKYLTTIQYGPVESVGQAVTQVWRISSLITKEIGRIVTGNRDLSSLGGPVSIAKGAGQSAKGGVVTYLAFLAMISLNLGVLNLLPLPVLDGGHLLFLAIEKVKGSPISETGLSYCYRIGAILLIMLMGLAFFNDFSHS